jgi:hypothetical protein
MRYIANMQLILSRPKYAPGVTRLAYETANKKPNSAIVRLKKPIVSRKNTANAMM